MKYWFVPWEDCVSVWCGGPKRRLTQQFQNQSEDFIFLICQGNKRINNQNNDQSFPANPEHFFPSPESGGQLDRSLFQGTIGIDKLDVPTHEKNQTGDRSELNVPGNAMVLKSAGGTHRQTPAEPKESAVVLGGNRRLTKTKH